MQIFWERRQGGKGTEKEPPYLPSGYRFWSWNREVGCAVELSSIAGMYAHIFTTSHCLQTTSIHLLTRGVIVDGGGGRLDWSGRWFGMRQFAQLAFVPLCCTSEVTPCQGPQCHFLFATLQISMTKNYRMRTWNKSVFCRTFRPRFVCLLTNDPFKSTSIMVIHNGLVYWDPWASCWTSSLPPLLFIFLLVIICVQPSSVVGNPTDQGD